MLTNPEYAYKGSVLHCEDASLADIAVAHGTPAYVYSKAAIERSYRAYERALFRAESCSACCKPALPRRALSFQASERQRKKFVMRSNTGYTVSTANRKRN